MQEEWKEIKEFEGLYWVSNHGRVKSNRKILCGNEVNSKYASVMLCKNGNPKRYKIHRLVAEAFIPNPSQYPCVNHKDLNSKNNRIDNLEWTSYAENIRHAHYNGAYKYCDHDNMQGVTLNFRIDVETHKKLMMICEYENRSFQREFIHLISNEFIKKSIFIKTQKMIEQGALDEDTLKKIIDNIQLF